MLNTRTFKKLEIYLESWTCHQGQINTCVIWNIFVSKKCKSH